MKKILYVFDDINYDSGARSATIYQMKCISKYYKVKALSLSRPVQGILEDEWILDTESVWDRTEVFVKSFKGVVKSKMSTWKKALRFLYAVALRVRKGDLFFKRVICSDLLPIMEDFDAVIVVSEASKMRRYVASLKYPKKIQWIHTDYKLWSEFSDWTKAITKDDEKIYGNFDRLVALTEISKRGLLEKIPSLKEKVCVIPNLVDACKIRQLAENEISVTFPERMCKFVTVGRIDREKNCEEIIEICRKLMEEKIDFSWTIVGDGPLFDEIQKKIHEYRLQNYVFMVGRQMNPYPWMKRADYMVLLSKYEGTPVTIDEAATLGIPVIATAVGGIPEQIERYQNGVLVWNVKDAYNIIRKAVDERIKVENNMSVELINDDILRRVIKLVD